MKMEKEAMTGTQVLHHDDRSKVVAFYLRGVLRWTTTYTYDEDGSVKRMTRVFTDGTVSGY